MTKGRSSMKMGLPSLWYNGQQIACRKPSGINQKKKTFIQRLKTACPSQFARSKARITPHLAKAPSPHTLRPYVFRPCPTRRLSIPFRCRKNRSRRKPRTRVLLALHEAPKEEFPPSLDMVRKQPRHQPKTAAAAAPPGRRAWTQGYAMGSLLFQTPRSQKT